LLSVTSFPVSLSFRLAEFAAVDWPSGHGQVKQPDHYGFPANLRTRALSPVGEAGAGGQRVWVIVAKDPLDHRQRCKLVAGPCCIPASPV
jgi:hypothetical protein